MAADDLFVVVNPRSGKGRGGRMKDAVLAAFGGAAVPHALTEAPGDEERITRDAMARGFRRIVAVGGDGTWSNVANAIIRSGTDARLGIVPSGSGCDLAKSVGVPPRDLAACARIVREGHTRRIDAGRIEERYFLNVLGFGFDIAVIEDSWRVGWLGGDLLYLYCALRQLHRFPGFEVSIAVDGGAPRQKTLLMLVLASGRVFGGGFQIAPSADLGDGALDGVLFANMPLSRRLPLMVKLLSGTHASAPEVEAARGRSFQLRFARPPAYETDGEWNQAKSADLQVDVRPGALELCVPAPGGA